MPQTMNRRTATTETYRPHKQGAEHKSARIMDLSTPHLHVFERVSYSLSCVYNTIRLIPNMDALNNVWIYSLNTVCLLNKYE